MRSINPEGGGPIEGVYQRAKYLIHKGHTVEIVSLDAPDEDFIEQSSLVIHAVGGAKGKYGYSRNLKPWLDLHCHDYDVFIINGIWQYHSFAAHNVLSRNNIPYYVFTHGMLDPWFKTRYPLKHLKKCLYWLWGEYPVLRDAKKVLFTCEEEKVLARQSFFPYRCNEQVVNYGTAGHTGDEDQQRALFLTQFPHLKNQRYLLFLSRIHPKKGGDLLIEAFAKIGHLQKDLHLVIAGPDQVGEQAALQQLAQKHGIADKITWTGMLSGDMKWGAYLTAEAFILPSHQENFGIVVAEALSCRLPVLISNKVNIWQEITEDNAGLVADDTLSGCLNLLNRWLEMNDENKAAMSSNAHRCFINRFEITNAAMSLLEVIKE
jgi:glycosyltransferase involved in cell wall biosynthesis